MKKIPRSILLILVFLLVIVLSFTASKTLTVSTIQLRGSSLVGLNEIAGTPLFLINEANLTNNLLKKNPTIEEITLEKKYPNTLVVSAKKSTPVGILAVTNGYYALSGSGKIIAKERERTNRLPLITIGQKFLFEAYGVGEMMGNQQIITAAYLLGEFAQNKIPIETVEIRGFDVVVCKGAGHTYLFSASKNNAEQFSDFLVVYRQFFVEGKKYRSIDVRFEKPVVVLEK